MIREQVPQLVPLTQAYAKHFSELPHLRGDRDRASRQGIARMQFLENEHVEGMFYTPVWSVARLGRLVYRIDGGHSSLMLANFAGPFPAGIMVFLRQFEVDSLGDLAELFSRFDRTESVRTKQDNLKAHAGIHDELTEVRKTNLDTAISGIACGLTNCGEEEKMSEADQIRLVHHYREFILFAHKLLAKRQLKRRPVAGALFLSYEIDPAHALNFWTLVVSEEHPDRSHPTRQLAAFLRDNDLNEKAEEKALTSRQNNTWTSRAFFVKCICAWNHYCNGTTSEVLKYYKNSPIPRMLHPDEALHAANLQPA